MIPTNSQCIGMLSANNVPERVRNHSLLVARTAVHMAELLNSKGYSLDTKLIEASALLHDIARGRHNHAEAGAELLIKEGFGEISEIVRQHMKPDANERGRISEITVVYLADKYSDEDKLVPLEQRFNRKKDLFLNDSSALQSIEENYEIARKLQYIMEDAMGCHGSLIELLRYKKETGV